MEHQNTTWIKHEEVDQIHLILRPMYLKDALAFESSNDGIKEEVDLTSGLIVPGADFLQDPLAFESSNDDIKEDADVKSGLISKTDMIASAGYIASSIRLIKNSGQSCSISFEETVNQGVVHDEVEKGAEDTTDSMKFDTHRKGASSPEDSFYGHRPQCSLREREISNFSCSFCLKVFSSKYELIMHVFIHIDGVEPPIYVCRTCGKVFPSGDCLNNHFKWSDGDQVLPDENNIKCDCCGIHKNVKFLEGDQNLNVTEEIEKQSLSEETCETSIKYFSRMDSLKGHSSIQNIMKKYKCDICGRYFTLLGSLKRHTLTHTGKKPHKCIFCGRYFTLLGSLKRHTLTHTGKKPHTCIICGKTFSQVGNLKSHTLTHTGRKPHKCDICGKYFSRLDSLKRHSLLHARMKPHKCDICGESFTHLGSLKRHALMHTAKHPYNCIICGRSFTKSVTLKNHTLTHTGMKPYKCNYCGKYFTRLTYLKNHSLTHTGITPYKCDLCGKHFTLLRSFKRHSLTHT